MLLNLIPLFNPSKTKILYLEYAMFEFITNLSFKELQSKLLIYDKFSI